MFVARVKRSKLYPAIVIFLFHLSILFFCQYLHRRVYDTSTLLFLLFFLSVISSVYFICHSYLPRKRLYCYHILFYYHSFFSCFLSASAKKKVIIPLFFNLLPLSYFFYHQYCKKKKGVMMLPLLYISFVTYFYFFLSISVTKKVIIPLFF